MKFLHLTLPPISLHKPHPTPVLKRYQLEQIAEILKASRERPTRTIDTSGDAFRAMHHSPDRDARESVSPNDREGLYISLA